MSKNADCVVQLGDDQWTYSKFSRVVGLKQSGRKLRIKRQRNGNSTYIDQNSEKLNEAGGEVTE